MKIGELSKQTGVSTRLLRYYEEQGLLASHRVGAGHRHYAEDAPAVVRRIRILLGVGLPTKEIRGLLPCVGEEGATLDPCVIPYLREHLQSLDECIGELRETRAELVDLLATAERVA
jgi:DNA-binding transcriptional MerR regulator